MRKLRSSRTSHERSAGQHRQTEHDRTTNSHPGEKQMNRFVSFLAMSILIATLGSGLGYAQSSGSFNFSADTLSCTDIGGTLGGGTAKTALKTTHESVQRQRRGVGNQTLGRSWSVDQPLAVGQSGWWNRKRFLAIGRAIPGHGQSA
jgi:hypothetical protein